MAGESALDQCRKECSGCPICRSEPTRQLSTYSKRELLNALREVDKTEKEEKKRVRKIRQKLNSVQERQEKVLLAKLKRKYEK